MYTYSINKVGSKKALLLNTGNYDFTDVLTEIQSKVSTDLQKCLKFVKIGEKMHELTNLGLLDVKETTFKQILDRL